MNLKLILKLMILPVLGILIMLVPMVFFIKSIMAAPIISTESPGVAPFVIKDAGEYAVWRKTVGVTQSGEYHTSAREIPEGLNLQIQNADSSTTVPIEGYPGVTATVNGSSRQSLFKMNLEPGNYKLISSSVEPISMEIHKKALGMSDFFMAFGFGVVGVLLIMGGVIYALVVIVKTVTKRPNPEASS